MVARVHRSDDAPACLFLPIACFLFPWELRKLLSVLRVLLAIVQVGGVRQFRRDLIGFISPAAQYHSIGGRRAHCVALRSRDGNRADWLRRYRSLK